MESTWLLGCHHAGNSCKEKEARQVLARLQLSQLLQVKSGLRESLCWGFGIGAGDIYTHSHTHVYITQELITTAKQDA